MPGDRSNPQIQVAGAQASDLAASVVLGDFELNKEIGRGGMGTVYEARQISLQRSVALKVLAPHVASTPKAVARFRREAQAAAKLHHTHIVPIFAQGEASGSYFYAMELVEGASLNSVITDLRAEHRPETLPDQAETLVLPRRSGSATATKITPPDETAISGSGVRKSNASTVHTQGFGSPEFFHDAARNLADVADALEYAHANGVIHRDIKPHNLLFGLDGRLRVSDFGLARLAEQPGVTMTGEVVGSPLYMSPEQISGDPNSVDHRTDIYSLGATMYEWLTLKPPYPGETRERVISRILSSEPEVLRFGNPSVPADLETICLKAIERDLNRRYQSAGEFRDDLRRYLLNRPIKARRVSLPIRAVRFIARHQIAAFLGTALLLGVGLTWALVAKSRSNRIEKETSVRAQAEVAVAQQAAKEAQAVNERLIFAALNGVVPGGGKLAEKLTSGEFARTGLPKEMPSFDLRIGTPSEIARRAIKDFYVSIVSPNWPSTAEGVAEKNVTKINHALEKWLAGDAPGALTLLEEYLTSLPTKNSDLEAIQMHAALNAVVGKFEEMQADGDLLLSNGGNPRGYLWRGLANLMLNRVEPSLSDFTRAATSSNSPWGMVFRGMALLQADKTEEAKELFQQVLAGSANSGGATTLEATARLGQARALITEGDYAAALPEAEAALKLDPTNVHALTFRGECKYVTGDVAGAQADFAQAISLAGLVTELVMRAALVLGSQKTQDGSIPPEPGAADVKSRHGTETQDDSPPPVFDFLDPRRRQPRADAGFAKPQPNVIDFVRYRLARR